MIPKSKCVHRNGATPTNDETKAAVIRDAFGKCVYCETRPLHSSFGNIEHLKPKKRFPALTYEWTNLALVCTKCNNAKSDTYDVSIPPIDPFVEDPAGFLVAVGEWIWPQPGNDRAAETIALVDLNRTELLIDRRKRLDALRTLAEALTRTSGQQARSALQDQLIEELSNAAEYAFVSRVAALALGVVSPQDIIAAETRSSR